MFDLSNDLFDLKWQISIFLRFSLKLCKLLWRHFQVLLGHFEYLLLSQRNWLKSKVVRVNLIMQSQLLDFLPFLLLVECQLQITLIGLFKSCKDLFIEFNLLFFDVLYFFLILRSYIHFMVNMLELIDQGSLLDVSSIQFIFVTFQKVYQKGEITMLLLLSILRLLLESQLLKIHLLKIPFIFRGLRRWLMSQPSLHKKVDPLVV